MSDYESLDFSSIAPIEIPVIGPDGKRYVLREANGTAAKKYNNARIGGLTIGEDGKTQSISGAGDLEPLLVSLCLFGADNENDTNTSFTRPMASHQPAIEKWPSRVIKKLHDTAKEISNLDEGENPVKIAVETMLQRADSPISLDAFRTFLGAIEGKVYKPLKNLLREDPSKNLPKSTTAG